MDVTVMVCSADTRRRHRTTALIQQMGLCLVAEASDTPQALRLTHTFHPGLIIIDIEPYEHASLGMVTSLAQQKLAPLVLLTEPYHEQIFNTINEDYVMAYAIKPVNRWSLESAIRTALASFQKITKRESEIDKLKDTLETRKLMEKAKHILMETHKLTEAEAFRRLQKQSMNKGIAMKTLAEAIILNHEMK